MPRRRTRSRRTTRRLHRTRRHRVRYQFGGAGDGRIDLEIWKATVAAKRGDPELKGRLDYSIAEKLKMPDSPLTRETAPLLPSIQGKSEFAAAEQDAQTLLAAAASMVSQLGADTFSSPQAFKDKITALNNDPNLRESTSKLRAFMAELEKELSGKQEPIDLTNETNYPLFIWFAIANYDIGNTEEVLVPILGDSDASPSSTEM